MLNDNDAFQWSQMYTTGEAMRQIQAKHDRQQRALVADQRIGEIENAASHPLAIEDDDGDRPLFVPRSKASKLSNRPSLSVPPKRFCIKHRRLSLRSVGTYMYFVIVGLGLPTDAYDNGSGLHF